MRIGIIGYGNLGKALVRGLVLTGFSQNDIDINARTQKTRMIKNLIGLEKLIFNQADEKSHPFDFSFNYAFCYEQTSPLDVPLYAFG